MDRFYKQIKTAIGIRMFTYKGVHSAHTDRYQVSVLNQAALEYFTIIKTNDCWIFEHPAFVPVWVQEVEEEVLLKKCE
jgi:hypothetical protein